MKPSEAESAVANTDTAADNVETACTAAAAGCQCCGECCRGDMHVYLNPDDLKLIAGFMNLENTRQLFERSIVVVDRERNGAPIPRLRFSKGAAGCCPFLENRLIDEGTDAGKLLGLCRLHPHFKPLVCHLAPFHRTVDLAAGTETWGVRYPLPGCPGYSDFDENYIGQPDFASDADGQLSRRLGAETVFYRELAEMTDSGSDDSEIISRLYYLKADCQK